MEQDSIKYLPPEIITNILSRLDVRSIASSKCVSKPCLEFLSTDEFVKLHRSRSATALAVLTKEENSTRFTVVELEDEIDVESSHDHHYSHPITFNFLSDVAVEGSANGMLLLEKYGENAALYVCNPITREYIDLHGPQDFFVRIGSPKYGFGASKRSGQHKVVRTSLKSDCCHVYTLGTGLWRRVESPTAWFGYGSAYSGAFVDGNLHWLVVGDHSGWICCFDLETEFCSTLAVPVTVTLDCLSCFSALRDCLCVGDRTSINVMALWLMKEYGDDKSWTKECVINLGPGFYTYWYSFVDPLTVFKDGDVVMLWDRRFLAYYCNKTKAAQKSGVVVEGGVHCMTSRLFTPSFLSLKSFPVENVISL